MSQTVISAQPPLSETIHTIEEAKKIRPWDYRTATWIYRTANKTTKCGHCSKTIYINEIFAAHTPCSAYAGPLCLDCLFDFK